jgi:capsular exopolysaccharide synthesis family protein
MGRTHKALGKAEQEQNVTSRRPVTTSSVNGRHVPDIRWDFSDFDGYVRMEYERIEVIMKTPAQGKHLRTIAVSGCRAGNGATTTATLMAATLASNKRSRILLVDANLLTPSLDLVFAADNTAGLTDVLCDDMPPDACIRATGQENLFVMPTGGIPAHPAAIFERTAIERFLERAAASFDFIILDTAPLLQFPATCALASYVDGVLLVLQADRTLVDDAKRARRELERVNAHVIGAVLNRHEDYTPSFIRRFTSRS